MSSDTIDKLHKRSNNELVELIDKLKKFFKDNKGAGFNNFIKDLGFFENTRTPGGVKHKFDKTTLKRHSDELEGTRKNDSNLLYRDYLIALIERTCRKCEWDLDASLEFCLKSSSEEGDEPFRFAGDYYLYYSNSKENAVGKHPLHIDIKGNAKLALSLQDSKVIINGRAFYDGKQMLAINFLKEDSTFKFRYYMFSVMQEYPPVNLQRAYGLSIRSSHSMKPVARMEVLVVTKDSIDSGKTVYDEFIINSEKFIKEDKETKGLLTWLAGKLNRQIVAPSKPNEKYSRRIEEEYVDIHFQASCYTALRENLTESLLHLYQAYLHGFNKIELLEKEIAPGGCLEDLYLSPLKANTRHETLSHPELTCKELVEKITERSKHILSIPPNRK